MIKDCDSPYDGRHEGAARLGQDRHFTGSVSQYHEGCGPLSSFRAPSGRVFANVKAHKCGHIERTRATVAPRHSPPVGVTIPVAALRPVPVARGCAAYGARPVSARRFSAPAARGPSLAAPETFVAARVVLPGPVGPLAESAWPGAMIVCRKDARFSAADVIVCRRGRYADPNYPLRAMCPACLLSVVPVGTLCRCPGTAGHLPGEDHDVGAGPAPTPSRRSLATCGE